MAPTRRRHRPPGPPATRGPARAPCLDETATAALVLHRDGLVLVLNKPAGLPVHAGPGGGPNLEDSFVHLRFGLPAPPALAHRLDRDTSGCLVLGRHRKALAKLGRLFRENRVGKTYWALLDGVPDTDAGTVDAPLAKQTSRADGWRMAIAEGGRPSVTDWRVLGHADGLAWVEFRPHTGRTHQIRVHAAHLGCPVLGDPVYGRTAPAGPMMLHARAITLPLQATRPPLTVTAPVPPHLAEALPGLGWAGEAASQSSSCSGG